MPVVEYLAKPPTCSLGNFTCTLGGSDANILATDDCSLANISGSVDGVERDEIARTLPDALGCFTSALGCTFASVSDTAANAATGAVLRGLGGWLWCSWLRLGILAGGSLAADGEG
jgi:hypothetical protein